MSEEASAGSPHKVVRDPKIYRDALNAWMHTQMPAVADLRVYDVDMPVATGFSNETVFFSTSWSEGASECTHRYVARIEPEDGGIFPVQTAPCQVSAQLQHRIMSAVAEQGVVPLPPLLPYESDLSVLGRPFFVMEFVEGVIPADVPRYSQAGFLAEEATPAERERMLRSGIEAMAAINGIPWRDAGIDWLDASGSGTPAMEHQLRIYRDYVVGELDGRDHPVMMRALDWLDSNAPAVETGLSWGDARLGNMIWQDYRCAAVVDWEACALCPPEADIGWWVMFDRMSFDDMGAPRLEGFPTREEMVAQWESQSGRSVAGDIHYWEAYAVMRFCAIMIKLGDRFVRAGIAPPENSPSIKNGVTDALARLLGIEQS
jgi:aminoglycoside phosphotransferase (APT) family kinase protein